MTATSNIGITLIPENERTLDLTLNKDFWLLNALVMPRVLDKDLTTPPVSPSDGDTYIIGGSATGAWCWNWGSRAASSRRPSEAR